MTKQRYSYIGLIIVLALSFCVVYLLAKFTQKELGWSREMYRQVNECVRDSKVAVVVGHSERVECHEPGN
jgi:uncharacterized membrane protein